MEKSQVYAKQNYIMISPKKVAPVLDLVRGKDVSEALRVLKFDHTKGAKITLKVLKSAVANAKDAKKLDDKNLFVSETWVGPGPIQKRGRFVGRGHYSPILKRTSNILVGLSERKAK